MSNLRIGIWFNSGVIVSMITCTITNGRFAARRSQTTSLLSFNYGLFVVNGY